ncbi:IS1 family transposase [Candidatus Woesearchaeota archaeon]|nr:IS1 family transposase [Candidatus Woesearchaeota archaeon]
MPENSLKCPYCNSMEISKQGKRKGKLQQSQKLKCVRCNKNFTDKKLKHKSYPAHIIFNTISYYNLGNTQSETSAIIKRKYKTEVPQRTISEWLKQYKDTCTFRRLRNEAKKLYSPDNIIDQYEFLHNNLNYKYQIHNFKLNYLAVNNEKLQRLKLYLEKIPTKDFPHHIFKSNHEIKEKSDRASQADFKILNIKPLSKQNLANKLCKLALNLAKTNKERHQSIQDFFIANDSTTIAAEIPIYLTHDDLLYFSSRNFNLNPNDFKTPITGHMDILQIRNNLIHILDYKPNANKENPVHQLTIYALALASKAKLPLTMFKCAWFDENNYFEFFPLHAVYKTKK